MSLEVKVLRQIMSATKYVIRVKVRSDKLLNAAIQAHHEYNIICDLIEKLLNWSHLNLCKNNSQQFNDVSVKYFFFYENHVSCFLINLSVQDGKLFLYKNLKK